MIEEIRKRLNNPYYLAFLGIIFVATVIRFQNAFFEGIWVDEGRYARIAFELSNHLLDYSVIEEWRGQITSYPPVYPYLLAISTAILGKTDFAIRIVSPLMGVAAVAVTYFFGREIADKKVGLIAAALLAVNPILWFLSERILVGATLTAFYTATILALYIGLSDREYSRYGLWALGPLAALTLITKQPAYTLGILIPLYFIYVKRDEIRDIRGGKFTDSRFYKNTLTDRNYYIGIGLGVLTLLPWSLRNLAVCGSPLCSLGQALSFAAGGAADPTVSSVQGIYYFIVNLPVVLTLPITLLILGRVGYYILDLGEHDPDSLVKRGAAFIALNALVYLALPKLSPMMLVSSIALFSRSDAEKLVWLWAGLGIGFMSIPQVKVPRYIVFVVPGLVTLAAMTVNDLANWLSEHVDYSVLTPVRVAAILVVPLIFVSYIQGAPLAARGGFAQGEQAGNWIADNTAEDARIVSSSPTILRYYIYPRMSYRFPGDASEFEDFITENDISYVQADIYERAQPQWAQTQIAPYRIPNQMRAAIQSGELSQQEAAARFKNTPTYLEPVATFGRSQNPLNGQPQPVAIVYRINRSEMP